MDQHPIELDLEAPKRAPSHDDAMAALHHVHKEQANHPHLYPPNPGSLGGTATPRPAPMDDAAILQAYIKRLEAKLDALSSKIEDKDDLLSLQSAKSPVLGEESFEPGEWIAQVKKYKKFNYRYGSAQLYDDSESFQEIQHREHQSAGGFVIQVYHEYDWDGRDLSTKMEIRSPYLLHLLRSCIHHYPDPEFNALRWQESEEQGGSFAEPYTMFFTFRHKLLEKACATVVDDLAQSHLKLLLEFLKREKPDTWQKLDEIEAGTCKKISFADLWLLYPPGTPVYSVNEDRQMIVYARNAPDRTAKGQHGVMNLTCWSAKYQAGVLVRDFSTHSIQPFLGEEPMRELKLVPLPYHGKRRETQSRLKARGKRYYELNQGHLLQDYFGTAFPRFQKDEPIRVVVDQDTYQKYHSHADSPSLPDAAEEFGFALGEESLIDESGKPKSQALECCYPNIGVYSLRDKEWKEVRVDDLKLPRFREKAFKRLVMKNTYKRAVMAAVEAYTDDTPGFTDIVNGKGRGIVILLYGPPGVGKTLTAECVSEEKKRPLYPVSCGELGTDPLEIEKRLKQVFFYAVTWKAILLLDEADIFLQERDSNSVQRNALVSVFLRELEYFDGILFMTTNRPGDIDDAVHARIHLSIGMPALNADERATIWSNFIRELDPTTYSSRAKSALMMHASNNYAANNLNGRQIRNSMRMAIALAHLDGATVDPGHLDQVMDLNREFKDYLEKTWNMNEDERAAALGRRASVATHA